jgi:crotonobetainyl-CoA:carnitine CoA-transferase CaiB-like acyl-CoA transferase
MMLAIGNNGQFARFCEAAAQPGLACDERFATNTLRVQHREALIAQLDAVTRTRTTSEWIALLEDKAVPCGPINDIAAVVADPHVRARHMIVSVDDPVAGRLEMPGNPIKLDGMADGDTRPPAPELDADRARILAELER